jgi:hypothetical protein
LEYLEVPTHFAIGVRRQKKKHELKKCNEPRNVKKANPYQLERNQKQICGLRLVDENQERNKPMKLRIMAALVSLAAMPSLQAQVISSGQTLVGAITASNRTNRYTFAASAGDTITVAVGETVPSNFAPKVTLYGPDGATLGWSDGDTGASVTRRATLSGNHYAVVEDYWASYDGNYRFTMVKAPGVQADTDGRVVQSGETVVGTLPVGDLDVFTFAASAGDTITVAVGESGGDYSFAPLVTLYGPDGAVMGSDWGGTGGSVTRQATLSGNHYAVVEDYWASYDGNYRFTLSGTITPPTGLRILGQPLSVFRQTGENATFSVSANGQPPLHYQWHNGTGTLANATNSSLTITNAQADASYYVVVINSYGSVTSQSAQLKILVDYNTAIATPISPTPPPPPPKPPSQHNLVVVTHGWQPIGIPQWIYDMTNSIGSHLPNSSWTVFALSWNGLGGAGTIIPGQAAGRAEIIGKKFGLGISAQGWSHVHFIGHSAGAVLIQAAAEELRANSASPVVIHTTFLDPYDWSFFGGPSRFGSVSDWSDHYFESDITGPLTGGQLDHSYNVDISGLDPHTFGAHEWAYEFYQQTVTGLGSIYQGFGFPLSKEGGSWDSATNVFHPGNSPYLLGGGPALCSSSVPIQHNPNLVVNALSSLWSGTVYVTLNGLDLFTSLISPQKLEPWSTNTFGSPVWLSLGITVTNRINFVRFDATFTSATNSAGLLTVYWNTNEIGVADETVTTPGLQDYSFALPATYSSGNYVLGFRLDSFENIVSSISITNVSLGFAGLTNTITLGISRANGSNQLTLTGPTNYNYLVQSSSNLVDWIPAAIVPNPNGTALFSDPTATNYSRRFYRAVSP